MPRSSPLADPISVSPRGSQGLLDRIQPGADLRQLGGQLLVPAFVVAEATLVLRRPRVPRHPVASWGAMLHDASSVSAIAAFPWLLSPAVAIFVVVLGLKPGAAGRPGNRASRLLRTSSTRTSVVGDGFQTVDNAAAGNGRGGGLWPRPLAKPRPSRTTVVRHALKGVPSETRGGALRERGRGPTRQGEGPYATRGGALRDKGRGPARQGEGPWALRRTREGALRVTRGGALRDNGGAWLANALLRVAYNESDELSGALPT